MPCGVNRSRVLLFTPFEARNLGRGDVFFTDVSSWPLHRQLAHSSSAVLDLLAMSLKIPLKIPSLSSGLCTTERPEVTVRITRPGAQLIDVDAPSNVVTTDNVVEGFETGAEPVPVVIPRPHDGKHRFQRSA